jgi:hypothetical protein
MPNVYRFVSNVVFGRTTVKNALRSIFNTFISTLLLCHGTIRADLNLLKAEKSL